MALTADALLSSPEYFRCEQFHAVMRKKACVQRQDQVKESLAAEYVPRRKLYSLDKKLHFAKCLNCEQGLKIKHEMEEGENKMAEKSGADDAGKVKAVEDTKKCSKCGDPKSLDEFSRDKAGKDGRKTMCKECERDYQKAYSLKKKMKRKKPKTVSSAEGKTPPPAQQMPGMLKKAALGQAIIDLVLLEADGPKDDNSGDPLFSAYQQSLGMALSLRRAMLEKDFA